MTKTQNETTKSKTLKLLGAINADMRIGKWAKTVDNDDLTLRDVWNTFPRGDLLIQLAGRSAKVDRRKIVRATCEIVRIATRYAAGQLITDEIEQIVSSAEAITDAKATHPKSAAGWVLIAAKMAARAAEETAIASCAGAASKAIWEAGKAAEAAVADGVAPSTFGMSPNPEEAFAAAMAEAADVVRKHIAFEDLQ